MKKRVSFLGSVLCVILMAAGSSGESSEPMRSNTPALKLALPFEGPGQLAMIVSRGWPPNWQLVVATSEGVSALPLEKPRTARWLSSRELIVVQSGPGGWLDKILRVNSTGKILETITDGYFVRPEPAPDGLRLAVVHVLNDDIFKGTRVLEIRGLAQGFHLLRAFPYDQIRSPFLTAWSPDGARLAVSIASLEGTRYQARLAVVSPDTGAVTRLYDGPNDREQDERGVMLMFWHASGIYAWSGRGVLRCDPAGAGCEVVYDPGEAWHVIGGTLVGKDVALLRVKDVRADFLEPRAKEIHRLDLTTGKGEVWVRLPEDIFVSDIDWTGPDPQKSDRAARP